MASVDRRRDATPMGNREQGTLLYRTRWKDDGVHHRTGLDFHRKPARTPFHGFTGGWARRQPAAIRRLPRRQVSDQPARSLDEFADHPVPQLEDETVGLTAAISPESPRWSAYWAI